MENLQNIEELFNLMNTIKEILPNEVEESLETNGIKINLNKNDNRISISISMTSNEDDTDNEEEFDDSSIKEVINDYKDSINELDDCLFVEAVDDMRQSFDIKRFDKLLNQDSFTEEEANEVGNMINYSTEIICSHLKNKIDNLRITYSKFQ